MYMQLLYIGGLTHEGSQFMTFRINLRCFRFLTDFVFFYYSSYDFFAKKKGCCRFSNITNVGVLFFF